jgi:hypothetical protein
MPPDPRLTTEEGVKVPSPPELIFVMLVPLVESVPDLDDIDSPP